MSREFGQLIVTDERGTHLGQVAFRHFWEAVVHPGADDEIQNRVARNSSRSLSSTALGFSLTYERCVSARVSMDKFEKRRPRRRLRSEAGSKSRATNRDVTGTSPELRERHSLTPIFLVRQEE